MNPERILVVDDEPGMLRSVQRLLSPYYAVATAATGEAAVRAAAELRPDLAVLDIRMPERDGFELAAELRKTQPDLDVIFMTGAVHELDGHIIRAIRERAFYFVQKPFDRDVLLTLVERCLELRRLEAENRSYLQQLERELENARAFQQGMLPPARARVGDFTVHAHYEPSERLGGDHYDHQDAGGGALAFLIADVSGHGVSAAMLTANVKSAFHGAHAEGYAPQAVVEHLASSLRSFDEGRFVTLFCGLLRPDRSLEYVNAGHPPPLVIEPGGARRKLGLTGPLISPTLAGLPLWEAGRIELVPHSQLFACTDGILEARGEEGFFGEERLLAALGTHAPGGAQRITEVLAAVHAFTGGRPLDDDLTLLAVDT